MSGTENRNAQPANIPGVSPVLTGLLRPDISVQGTRVRGASSLTQSITSPTVAPSAEAILNHRDPTPKPLNMGWFDAWREMTEAGPKITKEMTGKQIEQAWRDFHVRERLAAEEAPELPDNPLTKQESERKVRQYSANQRAQNFIERDSGKKLTASEVAAIIEQRGSVSGFTTNDRFVAGVVQDIEKKMLIEGMDYHAALAAALEKRNIGHDKGGNRYGVSSKQQYELEQYKGLLDTQQSQRNKKKPNIFDTFTPTVPERSSSSSDQGNMPEREWLRGVDAEDIDWGKTEQRRRYSSASDAGGFANLKGKELEQYVKDRHELGRDEHNDAYTYNPKKGGIIKNN